MSDSFTLLDQRPIPGLNIVVERFRHAPTGARHIHFASADPHNTFSVSFLTPAMDDRGAAHVLEHMVLCGSQRYRARNTFFAMGRRSLASFMNAITFRDHTTYPFATANPRDHDNLLRVYLDAVFFPLLREADFQREGHRLDDSAGSGAPRDQGIVYNEMRGALESPTMRLSVAIWRELFPGSPYAHVNAGLPAGIAQLQYRDIPAFHRRYYRPGNATFMSYGQLPAAHIQQRVMELALDGLAAHGDPEPLSVPQCPASPRELIEPWPTRHAEDDDEHLAIAWAACPTTDTDGLMDLLLLEQLLMGNSASPLLEALESWPHAKSPSGLCGVDDSGLHAVFTCGLHGLHACDRTAARDLILGVLGDLADKGFTPDELRSALHTVELHRRGMQSGDYPYGLSLTDMARPIALHGGDPGEILDFDRAIIRLRTRHADPGVLKTRLRDWFVDNPHRVCVTLVPEMPQDVPAMPPIAQADQSVEMESATARHPLPGLTRADIDPDFIIPEGEYQDDAGRTCFYPAVTNGMAYARLVVELPKLSPAEIELLPALTQLFAELGRGGLDHKQTQRWRATHTGGLGAYTWARTLVDRSDDNTAILALAGGALATDIEHLLYDLELTLSSLELGETPRLRDYLRQYNATLWQGLSEHGAVLATLAAAGGLSPAATVRDRWGGARHLLRFRRIAEQVRDVDGARLLGEKLAELLAHLRRAPRHLLVIGPPDMRGALMREGNPRIAPATASLPWAQPFAARHAATPGNQVLVADASVNYVARAWAAVPLAHPDTPAFILLGRMLEMGYLHTAIREHGGAYGVQAGYDADTATFRIRSHRDPHTRESLDKFAAALCWLQSTHDQGLLDAAVLGVMSHFDYPYPPFRKATNAFLGALFGRTPEFRRALRRSILKVTLADIQRVAARYLTESNAHDALLCSPAAAEAFIRDGFHAIDLTPTGSGLPASRS